MHSISARAEVPLKGMNTVLALLFQESAGTVYSFQKQLILKGESTQPPAQLRSQWLRTGRPDNVTAEQHSTALRLSRSRLKATF